MAVSSSGGRFEFEDGGIYCGEWEEGKAHGYGICTGPKGEGEYAGAYSYGFEASGVYTMPKGSTVYQGQWQNGKKHGLGVEYHAKYIYRGEWNQGVKGRYGLRQSRSSQAKYEGTWSDGLQDGYGAEMYADGGTYQGQWLRGMRHGYGIRRSVPYGVAAQYHKTKANEHASCNSLHSEQEGANIPQERNRGGFVLRSSGSGGQTSGDSHNDGSSQTTKSESVRSLPRSESPQIPRVPFLTRIKRSISNAERARSGRKHLRKLGSLRSSGSSTSCNSEDSGLPGGSGQRGLDKRLVRDVSFDLDDTIDPSVTETYIGEWKNDKRSGFGISERSDGLKYEGEWFNNKKYGYGVTILRDGTREEGKYKNNVLVTAGGKRRAALWVLRSSKLRERIEASVSASAKSAQFAMQKAETTQIRVNTAKERAAQADVAAAQAREDSEKARVVASKFGADFNRPGPDISAPLQPHTASSSLINHVSFSQQNLSDPPAHFPPPSNVPPAQPPNPYSSPPDGHAAGNPPSSASRSSRPRFVPKFPTLPSESPSDESAMITPPSDYPGRPPPFASADGSSLQLAPSSDAQTMSYLPPHLASAAAARTSSGHGFSFADAGREKTNYQIPSASSYYGTSSPSPPGDALHRPSLSNYGMDPNLPPAHQLPPDLPGTSSTSHHHLGTHAEQAHFPGVKKNYNINSNNNPQQQFDSAAYDSNLNSLNVGSMRKMRNTPSPSGTNNAMYSSANHSPDPPDLSGTLDRSELRDSHQLVPGCYDPLQYSGPGKDSGGGVPTPSASAPNYSYLPGDGRQSNSSFISAQSPSTHHIDPWSASSHLTNQHRDEGPGPGGESRSCYAPGFEWYSAAGAAVITDHPGASSSGLTRPSGYGDLPLTESSSATGSQHSYSLTPSSLRRHQQQPQDVPSRNRQGTPVNSADASRPMSTTGSNPYASYNRQQPTISGSRTLESFGVPLHSPFATSQGAGPSVRLRRNAPGSASIASGAGDSFRKSRSQERHSYIDGITDMPSAASGHHRRRLFSPGATGQGGVGLSRNGSNVSHNYPQVDSSFDHPSYQWQHSVFGSGDAEYNAQHHNHGPSGYDGRGGAWGGHNLGAGYSPKEDGDNSSMGSMPDLSTLGRSEPELTREEVSRLSSARRREIHRLREEAEMRRQNPLLYLSHPGFQNWLHDQRLLIFVVLLNLCLAVIFYYLIHSAPSDLPGREEE